ncbi:MAG: hypothetical protein IKO93_08485 [Lentisphaeria bacterium]|nr:hypothetical protein [Lentisphaeria bacterium]
MKLAAAILSGCLVILQAEELPLLRPAPEITGKPGHPGWKNALRIPFKSGEAEARIGRSETHLYIAVDARHGAIDYKVNTLTGTDSPVYLNDCLEAFISPTGGKDLYQIAANVNGAVFDQRRKAMGRGDVSWDSGTKAAGSYGRRSFYIEMAVPIMSLAPLNGGIRLMLNSYQRWRLRGEKVLGQPNRPDTFTTFLLPQQTPLELESAVLPKVSGQQTVQYRLRNSGTAELNLTGDCSGSPATVRIPPGQTAELKCPVLLKPEQENVIRLTLGENGRERIRVYRHVKPVKLFHAWLLSDILYEGEPVPVKIQVNEQPTEAVRVDFLKGKVRCRYKNEIIELPCQTIESPWSKP